MVEEKKELSTEIIQSNADEILNLFDNIQIINSCNEIRKVEDIGYPPGYILRDTDMCFFRVKQLSYDEKYPHREAFENVLLSLDDEEFNFVYILTGTSQGIDLCIGVVRNKNQKEGSSGNNLSAPNYGKIVQNVFTGNFNGSELENLRGDELKEVVIGKSQNYKNAGVITGIPSMSERNHEDYDFQGIDRLINSMLGLEWRLVVVCEPVPKQEIMWIQSEVYELYNRLSVCAKQTLQHSENDGKTISFGKNVSQSTGKNWSYNRSYSKGTSRGDGSRSSSSQSQDGNGEGSSQSNSTGESHSVNINRGSSRSVTVEIANKQAQEIMNYIDKELLERLKIGFSKGLFKTSVYYMAKEATDANRLKAVIMSLFQGGKSGYSPLTASRINLEPIANVSILKTYQNQYISEGKYSCDALMLLGRPFYNGGYVGLNTYLTSEEISLFAGLPQKEVPGIRLKEGVDFGLNENRVDENNPIKLGVMVQRGRPLEKMPFYLSRNSLAKHTFVAGVTGSGKTTTCHRLLVEANMPFLVIEPAKTEYRTLINSKFCKNVVVFTLGNEGVAPIRLNPCELIPGELISAHVDMIKATFTSAFPMEASMPQILEEAIYQCYEKRGWDINASEHRKYKEKAFEKDDSFPILADLLVQMEEVVKRKHFGTELQQNYVGSLVSRLSNLTVGSKGSMLNCQRSTDFKYIVENNVILEMEELKSPEDKALLMGFILSRLSAVIKEKHKQNKDYHHLTLIEEAHRLLSKVEYGDSGSKKGAVETFTDLLAEVRKYGEGLIVVDQIPNKLASEVLKNTNTKIIHKLLARDDKEAVGDTMLMNDKQKEYLSALAVGNAVVFTENTDAPIHIRIDPVSNTSEEEISNDKVIKQFNNHKDELGICYKYFEILSINNLFNEIAKEISKGEVDEDKRKEIIDKINKIAETKRWEKKDIWRQFVRQRSEEHGQWAANQEEDAKEIVNYLVRFFVEKYETVKKEELEDTVKRYLDLGKH